MSESRFTRWSQVTVGQRVEIRTRTRTGFGPRRDLWVPGTVQRVESSSADVALDGRPSGLRTRVHFLRDIRPLPRQYDPREEPHP